MQTFHRKEYRIWNTIFRNTSDFMQDAESAWTDLFSNTSFRQPVKNKVAVHNSVTGEIIKVAYWNIESLKKAGLQAELLTMMKNLSIMILFLSETKCSEDNYRSGEFFIIKMGRAREPYGVAVIIHRKIMNSIIAIRAVSQHIIYIQIKITGGLFTLFGVYAPHEGRPLDERSDFS